MTEEQQFVATGGSYVMEDGGMKPVPEKKHSPWQYRTIEGKDQVIFLNILAEAGADGWELIHIEPMHGYLIGFMKRGPGE